MSPVTEADIFQRIIDASYGSLTPEAARALQLGYTEADHAQMDELASKSNDGTMNDDERRELQSYILLGDVISTLKSKARLMLIAEGRV